MHPTQLYETLICLGIWAFGLWLVRRRPRSGVTGMAVLALLGVERFVVELLRAKDDRFIGGLTVAQLISVGVVLVAVWLLLRRRRAAAPVRLSRRHPGPSGPVPRQAEGRNSRVSPRA